MPLKPFSRFVITTFEAINTFDMPRFLIKSVVDMQEMLEVVDHPTLKMQFDCYHMARMNENLATALRDNINAIVIFNLLMYRIVINHLRVIYLLPIFLNWLAA